MMMKVAVLAFVVLVFIGLGFSGTMNAAVNGYQKVEQNPTVQGLQNKVTSMVKGEVTTQIHNVENAATEMQSS